MATQVGVGISHHRNPVVAGKQAAQIALTKAGIKKPDFVFMFASVGYDQRALLNAVREATSGANLCGCSGEGIITNSEADESNFSVGIMVIRSDEFYFSTGMTTALPHSWSIAGSTVGQAIQSQLNSETAAMFLFAEGLTFNFDAFVTGLEQKLKLNGSLPIFGGTAGDNWQLKRTYQYCNEEIVTNGVTWALLSGNVRVASAVNHGCVPIGVERKITRCEGNVIYEIDGQPVLEVLKEYLVDDEIDNWSKTIVNLCLGFKAASYMQSYDEYLIRFMPAKDDHHGSITIPTEVIEGTSVWMTRRDYEKVTNGINRIAAQIKEQLGGNQPQMIFQFDCAGRGKTLLREQQKIEILKKLQGQIGADIPWLGFHTYGEIGPVAGYNCFHNYTVVLAAIY